MPYQFTTSKFGSVSFAARTSGKADIRFGPVVASARRRPASICGCAIANASNTRLKTYSKLGRIILPQPDQFAWQVFDKKVLFPAAIVP
jgi:hypothetical protein